MKQHEVLTLATQICDKIGSESRHTDADIVSMAMSSVQTITSVASWSLAVIGLGIALIAFFGWKACIEAAEKKAEEGFKQYMATNEFKELIERKVETVAREEAQEKFGNTIKPPNNVTSTTNNNGEAPFPTTTDKQEGGQQK